MEWFRVAKNKYITGVNAPVEDHTANVLTKPGDTKVIVSVGDFHDSKKQAMTDWSNIAALSLDLIQQGKAMQLKGNRMLQSLEWTSIKAGNQFSTRHEDLTTRPRLDVIQVAGGFSMARSGPRL